jgi:hypothetical protein
MKILRDPVTGKPLEVFSMKGESNEVYRAWPEAVIHNLSWYHNITETEVERRLVNSDIDHPIEFNDEVFWCEPK